MLETKKYVLTVEGETEQWYFIWLRDQINGFGGRTHIMFQLFQRFSRAQRVSIKEQTQKLRLK